MGIILTRHGRIAKICIKPVVSTALPRSGATPLVRIQPKKVHPATWIPTARQVRVHNFAHMVVIGGICHRNMAVCAGSQISLQVPNHCTDIRRGYSGRGQVVDNLIAGNEECEIGVPFECWALSVGYCGHNERPGRTHILLL